MHDAVRAADEPSDGVQQRVWTGVRAAAVVPGTCDVLAARITSASVVSGSDTGATTSEWRKPEREQQRSPQDVRLLEEQRSRRLGFRHCFATSRKEHAELVEFRAANSATSSSLLPFTLAQSGTRHDKPVATLQTPLMQAAMYL
jgi:hypothetical protein